MFAGHLGVGLAIGRAERRVNVGLFVAAALLLDFVLWLFILLGWESVRIPADFATTHQVDFSFPYSHGLAAAVAWSALSGAIAWLLCARLGGLRWRTAVLVAVAVFSHWVLDALVHRPELPLIGGNSTMVGLSLWNHMPVALVTEAAFVGLGLYLFLSGSRLPRGRLIALAVLSIAIFGFTVAGLTVAPPPPSALAMAGSSLVTLVVVCLLVAWLARPAKSDRA